MKDGFWGNALVITDGKFRTRNGKTAHGLVRETQRFAIKGVIDEEEEEGTDAGEALDGKKRNIPFFPTIKRALSVLKSTERPQYCIVGIATHGGKVTPEIKELAKEALMNGMSMINGLHDYLSDDPELEKLTTQKNLKLYDLRKPKPKSELHFWHGEIYKVKTPRIAIFGTDCNIGKRTTSRFLLNECRAHDIKTELIYTGQTGWMQGGGYGFVLDSVVNDFVSGELEYAITSCNFDENPQLMLLEGQSSLTNPSGPCGAEYLLSGGAKGVILQHAPGRVYFEGYEDLLIPLPKLRDLISIVRLYGAEILAITLNDESLTEQELREHQSNLQSDFNIPVILPLQEGVTGLIPLIKNFMEKMREEK